MKKIYWVLIFIVGFFVVFAVSAVSTFMFTLNRDDGNAEDATEAVYTGGSILPQGNVIEAETTVTRVTPTLTVEDAIIIHSIYGENEEVYEKPSLDYEAFDEEAEDAEEAEVLDEEKAADDANAAEAPKTEEKNEEVKTPEKTEEKQEEVKSEEKKEETPAPKVEESKVEEAPKAEEAPKVEEKVEEAKPQLNPNIQTSDSGL